MAKITTALVKELEQKVSSGEISYSRMVEVLNEQSKLNQEKDFEYYKTKSSAIAYKGERHFKFRWDSSKVLQVCHEVNNGTKRGKGHYIGIYEISRLTMFSNWYPNYVESCDENEFNEAFEKSVSVLKNKYTKQ
jgi:hypothetical protein